jgi:two-component system response regulator EvgA
MAVVGTYSEFVEALQQARRLKPDVILVGVGQYNFEGIDYIPRLRVACPQAQVIVLGSLNLEVYRRAALVAGADAFVAKITLHHDLLPAIWQCANPPFLSKETVAAAAHSYEVGIEV